MPRSLVMWLTAGGAALASAALTYAVTRPSVQPVQGRWRRPAWPSRRSHGAASREAAREASMRPAPHSAFEAYRQDTLQRLTADERAFQDFLERLRHAQDRAEFDAFMADRKGSGGWLP